MQKDYLNAIVEGFELREEIENEIAALKKIHTASVNVSCSDDVISINSEYPKDVEAKVEIRKEEIIQLVLKDNMRPKDAICKLLKEKTCLGVHDLR